MTTFLAFGDVHLGASPDLGTPEHPRLEDQENTLHKVAGLAIAERVDGVLFTGDAFDKLPATPPQLVAWRSFVELLGDHGIGLVGIVGNHDVAAADEWTAPEVVTGPDYYDMFRRPGVSYAFPGVAVACLPWTPLSRLVAARAGGDRNVVYQEAAELLLATARDLRARIDGPAILLAHWSVSGAVTPTGREAGPDFGVVLPLAELEQLGFDAVILGHIHAQQILSAEPLVAYTGSPCVVDWSEWQTDHGVLIVEIGGKAGGWTVVEAEYRTVEDRPFVTVVQDFTGQADVAAFEPDATGIVEGSVVRFRYRVTAEQARRIDTNALRRTLAAAGAARVFLQPAVVREDRARVTGVDETLGPLDALNLYCDHHDLTGERAAAMAERTTRYLQEAGL